MEEMEYFANEMPSEMVEEETKNVNDVGDTLTRLLSMPYSDISNRLLQAGLDLKNTVVEETWRATGGRVDDFILYSGTLGTAYLLLESYEITNNKDDLILCSDIVKACDTASTKTSDVRDGTFVCGKTGVYALGAVVAKQMGDDMLLKYNLTQFKQINLPDDLPDELFYGRAGFLWACLFLNKHIDEETISSDFIDGIVNDIFTSGRKLGVKTRCPLMFEKYGEKLWGAAHGLAGISHVLLHAKLSPDQAEDLKGTIKYMIKNRFPSGNFPQSEQDKNKKDYLVHWCNGAPGVALTLVKAAEVFGDKEFVEAAADAADLVWRCGLLRHVSICHGISGNAYVFLALYRVTGNKKHLYRAKAFACFLLEKAHMLILEGQMDRGENPYSLFEGVGGMSYLFLDMSKPTDARFPATSCEELCIMMDHEN